MVRYRPADTPTLGFPGEFDARAKASCRVPVTSLSLARVTSPYPGGTKDLYPKIRPIFLTTRQTWGTKRVRSMRIEGGFAHTSEMTFR